LALTDRRALKRCWHGFEVIGDTTGTRRLLRALAFANAGRLRKRYGRGRWRKRKGFAEIRLPSGEIVQAELHWYEATGIGKREMKNQGVHLERHTHGKSSKTSIHLPR